MRIDKTMYDYDPAYREGYDDGYDDGYVAARDKYLVECKQLRALLIRLYDEYKYLRVRPRKLYLQHEARMRAIEDDMRNLGIDVVSVFDKRAIINLGEAPACVMKDGRAENRREERTAPSADGIRA